MTSIRSRFVPITIGQDAITPCMSHDIRGRLSLKSGMGMSGSCLSKFKRLLKGSSPPRRRGCVQLPNLKLPQSLVLVYRLFDELDTGSQSNLRLSNVIQHFTFLIRVHTGHLNGLPHIPKHGHVLVQLLDIGFNRK